MLVLSTREDAWHSVVFMLHVTREIVNKFSDDVAKLSGPTGTNILFASYHATLGLEGVLCLAAFLVGRDQTQYVAAFALVAAQAFTVTAFTFSERGGGTDARVAVDGHYDSDDEEEEETTSLTNRTQSKNPVFLSMATEVGLSLQS